MPHEPALITTIAAAFGLALIPGFVADIELRQQLAEIGVMLLIFAGRPARGAAHRAAGRRGADSRRSKPEPPRIQIRLSFRS